MAETSVKDAKLVQYLNEAYSKEIELQVALGNHIAMADAVGRKPYSKRLKEHLRETKSHAKQLERRIKKLGGGPGALEAPRERLASGAGKLAGVAKGQTAAAKGVLHTLRGTGAEEKLLKAAKTEYWNEHEEIATYAAIEVLADAVGDKETAKLAKGIRREEERMASFLERQIPTLTKAVVKAEIPAAERRSAGGRRRSSSSTRRRSSAGSSSSRSSSGRSGTRSSSSRSSSSRSGGSRSSSSRSSSARSGGSRSSSARSSSSRSRGSSSRRRSG